MFGGAPPRRMLNSVVVFTNNSLTTEAQRGSLIGDFSCKAGLTLHFAVAALAGGFGFAVLLA